MPLKKVFLKFAKKPDGSYEPSVSKQKTTIGAFLIPSGHFDNTGINANGEDIDGIRTVLADFFTKSPYTVQGTPLFFFDGTNNLVANVANLIGRSMSVKAGLGSLCLLASLSFSSIKTNPTIGRFQIDGTTTYCNIANVNSIDSSLFSSLLNGSTRFLSYIPPASVDMPAQTTKYMSIQVGSYNYFIQYTPQGITKSIGHGFGSDPNAPNNSVFFVNDQRIQNENDVTKEIRQKFSFGDVHFTQGGSPVLTHSYICRMQLPATFPDFTVGGNTTQLYEVRYATKNEITPIRMFANCGFSTISPFAEAQMIEIDTNKVLGTYAFCMSISGTNHSAYVGFFCRSLIYPKIQALKNKYVEFSSLCNIYTSHFAYYTDSFGTELIPYKLKARTGYIVKFPATIDGSDRITSGLVDLTTYRTTSPYVCGGVLYFTDPSNPNTYFYDSYNVGIGFCISSAASTIQLNIIVTYQDLSTETKTVSAYTGGSAYKKDAYFNVIGGGLHLSSIVKSSLNCVEINEATAPGLGSLNDFSSPGVIVNPNISNKKMLKVSVYTENSNENDLFYGTFLILSPKT